MAAIIKRNGKYLVRVRVTGNPALSKTFLDKRSAAAWAAEVEDAVRRGVFQFNRQDIPTLGKALTKYARTITPTKRGAAKEAYLLAALTRLPLARKPLDEIQAFELARMRDAWLKDLSPATVQRRMAVLSHLFNTAAKEWGHDLENPLLKVSKPRFDNRRTRTIEREELDAILSSATNTTIKALAQLAWLSAARLGELTALRWQDVDLEARTMFLEQTKNGESRDVPLVPAAVALIESLKPKTIAPLSGLVFHADSGSMSKAWSRAVRNARATYERDCERQGIAPDDDWLVNAHFHDLRHSCITRFAQHGLSTLKLAAISGHKSMQMLSRYSHISAHKLAQELAVLEQGAAL